MTVSIEQLPELRVAAVRHAGPFEDIPAAFAKLDALARQANLGSQPNAVLLAIYHNDPETTRPEDLRADAGLVVPEHTALPAGLSERRIPAGRYARVEHVGPYEGLSEAWARFKHDGLPNSGVRPAAGPALEIYRNTPMTAKPQDLVTHLYIAVV